MAEEALSSKLGVLEAYDRVSGFLAFAYIAGAAFVLLAPSLALIAACTSRASTLSFLSAVLAAAASLFLLSASIASVVIFVALRDAFNSALGPVGIRVSLSSRLFVTSFVAFLLSLAIAIVLSLRSRRAAPLGRLPPNRGMGMGPNGYADNKGTAADDNSDAGKAYNAAAVSYQPRSGLLGRVATWNRHRYVQIEKQPALVTDRRHEGSSAVLMDVNGTRSRGRGPMEDDEDWTSGDANEDDYAHPGRRITEAEAANGGAQKPQESIAMVSLRGGKLMDVNTAYEPYKSMTAKET